MQLPAHKAFPLLIMKKLLFKFFFDNEITRNEANEAQLANQ